MQRLYANRPNKTAAGMMKTHDRQKKQGRPEKRVSPSNPFYPFRDAKEQAVNSLLVQGTTDKLGRGMWLYKTNRNGPICPCCGQASTKWRLNDKGRAKLRRLKKQKSK